MSDDEEIRGLARGEMPNERRGALFADDPLPNSGSTENDGDDKVFMVEGTDDDDEEKEEEEIVRPLVVNDCICRNLAQLRTRLKFLSH